MGSGSTATSATCGLPRRSASSARRSAARTAVGGRHHPGGERVRGRPARRRRVPAVHPDQPSRRRLGRPDAAQPILIIADVGRALLLASIPIAYCARRADDLAAVRRRLRGRRPDRLLRRRLPVLPAVARRRAISSSRATPSSRSAARPPSSSGPASAGCSSKRVKAPVAVLVDAVSFVVSAFFVFPIKAEEPGADTSRAASGPPGMQQEVKEGLRYVFGQPLPALDRRLHGDVQLLRERHLLRLPRLCRPRARHLGRARSASSSRREHRLPRRRTDREPDRARASGSARRSILGAAGVRSLLLLALAPTSRPIPFLIAAQAISSMGSPIYNITQVSFRQAITPERLQGRMNSAMRFIVWGVMPLGALIGGVIATWFSVRTAIWVGAIGMSLAVLPGAALTRADAARDAGAGRRATAVGGRGSRRARPRHGRSGARDAPRLTAARAEPFCACPSYQKSRREFASSIRSCRPRPCCRRGRRTSRR